MNILLVLFYFTTILNFTISYVLLAANMEDFRSLAKQFVPENMADEILGMAKAAIERDKDKIAQSRHFRNEQVSTDAAGEDYESVTERTLRKKLLNRPKDGTTSKYELTLDDLVEKVKQRLQSELALMSATAAKKKTQHIIPSTEMPSDIVTPNDSSDVQETNQSPYREEPQGRYVEPTMIEENKYQNDERPEKKVKQKKEKQMVDKRYVAEMFVAQPPKYLYDLGKPVTVKADDIPRLGIPKTALHRQVNKKKKVRQAKRTVQSSQRLTPTTEAQSMFKGVDLINKNDSYEDYVIPKKDEDYDEPETVPVKYKTVQKNPYIQRQPSNQKNNQQQDVLDVFSDEDESTTKLTYQFNYEDDTTNYNNKKKRVIKNVVVEKDKILNEDTYFKQRPGNTEIENIPLVEPLAAVNIEHQIQPYVDQVQNSEPEQFEEFEQPVTEEVKARSEVIAYNDNIPIPQYVVPQINKHDDRNKNKRNQKPKMATVIPKRDGYKMTSPNYLVKLPIVGEKYQFDEPIPEEDRIPEKLEPMKNLKSIINGKVILL